MGRQNTLLGAEEDSGCLYLLWSFKGTACCPAPQLVFFLLFLIVLFWCTFHIIVPTVTLAVNQDQNSLLRVGQRVSSHYLLQVFHAVVRKPSGGYVTETGPLD